MADPDEFERFVATARPRLLRAFAGCRGQDAPDAAGEALAYAWEHWTDIRPMDNPVGYLYRVGQSRTRRPRTPPNLPSVAVLRIPDVEPALVPALLALPESQRTAVWLVHACQWRYAEAAEAMGTTASMVGNHVSRALARLRKEMDVSSHA